jgi:hypothetical protein
MKLKLDDVQVESFPTTAEMGAEDGTVHAFAASIPRSCPAKYTCPECASPAFPEPRAED